MNALAAELPARLLTDDDVRTLLHEASTLAFRVAYGVLRHREDAEDVAQDATVRAYRGLGSLRSRESFRPWVVRIAWRLALDRRKSQRRREARELAAFSPPRVEPTAEQIAAARQAEERMWRALEALPDDLRLVVVLAGVQGHGMREVAELLGLPEGTVKSRLHQARRRLLETLRCDVKTSKKT